MISYLSEYFSRMSLQQIRNFIQYEAQQDDYYRPYFQRLSEEEKPLRERITNLYPDKQSEEHTKAMTDVNNALSVYEDVFFEIGMKAGARILLHLLLEDETPLKLGSAGGEA